MLKDLCFDSGLCVPVWFVSPACKGTLSLELHHVFESSASILLNRVAAALRMELADRKSPCTKAINKAVRSRPSKLLLTKLCGVPDL